MFLFVEIIKFIEVHQFSPHSSEGQHYQRKISFTLLLFLLIVLLSCCCYISKEFLDLKKNLKYSICNLMSMLYISSSNNHCCYHLSSCTKGITLQDFTMQPCRNAGQDLQTYQSIRNIDCRSQQASATVADIAEPLGSQIGTLGAAGNSISFALKMVPDLALTKSTLLVIEKETELPSYAFS